MTFRLRLTLAALPLALAACATSTPSDPAEFQVLRQLHPVPTRLETGPYAGNFYVPSTLQTITWGYLPNRTAKPVLTVPSGATITFDTLSHEGMLEDQGRNPAAYFGS